jgi:hypothetical protein
MIQETQRKFCIFGIMERKMQVNLFTIDVILRINIMILM